MSIPNLIKLGYVCSEGGPILLGDAGDIRYWESDGSGADYEKACTVFEREDVFGGTVLVNAHKGIVWEMGGAGTGNIFLSKEAIMIVRSWTDGIEENPDFLSTIIEMPMETSTSIGEIEIYSETLAIMWAAECGQCITLDDIGLGLLSSGQRPSGDMVTGCSAFIVGVKNGVYQCLHNEIQINQYSARRCCISRQNKETSE